MGHFFNHDNNKQTAALGNSELSHEQRNSPDRDDNNTSIDGRWRPNTVTYGLLHMQKTGGTTINGELAMHYERVCGNKGYSHDYYSSNKKIRSKKENLNRKNGTKRILYLLKRSVFMIVIMLQMKSEHHFGLTILVIGIV